MLNEVRFACGGKKLSAFTLVELLVVITIIGIISSLVAISFRGSAIKARDNKRISDANLISSALSQYYTSNSRRYPLPGAIGSSTTYNSVNINDSNASWFRNALSSYVNPVPVDSDASYAYYYVYRNDGKKATVVVLGLEAGTAKCNISSARASATATTTASASVVVDPSLPTTLTDLATGFLRTHSTACYYVSL